MPTPLRVGFPFAAAVFAAMALAGSVSSKVPPSGYPSSMPSTPMPSVEGCSSSQRAFLDKAWRLAHFTTWRSKRVVEFILSQPASERAALWSRDYVVGDDYTSSPRRWFGNSTTSEASFIREVLQKAEARFRMQGDNVKGVKKLRCGQPGTLDNAHVDKCPAGNPGGDGPPSAYHFPIGTVVTCPSFWNMVNNQFVDPDTNLRDGAALLVHELMHHLSVDAKYVQDYHGDGVGGHPDKKYYGLDNVDYLAEKKRNWAMRNNDTYRFFTRGVGWAEPVFSGSWARKEPGASALYYDMSWDGLVTRWRDLAGKGQYLADVETYVRDGNRRYAAIWRAGPGGNADLYDATLDRFASHWQSVKAKQDLIDIELYKSGSSWRYLGVYRQKVGRITPAGLVRFGLAWDDLVNDWKASGTTRYLADVEAYILPSGKRYLAVFRPGSGNGSLLETDSWKKFSDYKTSRNGKEQLIDVELWVENGKWRFLGVWRAASDYGPLHVGLWTADFVAKWNDLGSQKTLVDLEEYSALPLRVP
jgi:Polyglycine hydrolase-like, structural repeat